MNMDPPLRLMEMDVLLLPADVLALFSKYLSGSMGGARAVRTNRKFVR
jgi:hypothetical protein